MVQRNVIIKYVDELLHISEFDDFCVNGMQVEGKDEISKIVLGVSVSKRFFELAIENDADLIIVHHGLFWKNDPSPARLTGIQRERVALLIKNDINLLGYHLPLDAHPELGNNAQIMKRLELDTIAPVDVGFLGKLSNPLPITEFSNLVNGRLETSAQIFPYGPKTVHRVFVMSGGSSRYYDMAAAMGADTFIGGDIKENIVRDLEEVGLNFIHAGHYNTEKFGIQALGQAISDQFNIPCHFIDVPNPV